MGISNLICRNATRTNNKLADNPYLCEVGTFLSLRARIKQMQQSGTLMYQYRKKLAEMQSLDDRFIDNDPDLNEESFDEMDEIDRFNAVNDLSEKLSQNVPEAMTKREDSKTSSDEENASVNASESVSEHNSEPEKA